VWPPTSASWLGNSGRNFAVAATTVHDGQYWLQTNQGPSGRNASIARSEGGCNWTEAKSGASFEQPDGLSGGGNHVFWNELGQNKWLSLQEFGMFGNIHPILLYSSHDGLAWKLETKGKPVSALQPVAGAPVSGPAFASTEGELHNCCGREGQAGTTVCYSLWHHATNGTGLAPSDIFHAHRGLDRLGPLEWS
jgi:hypothetical protein